MLDVRTFQPRASNAFVLTRSVVIRKFQRNVQFTKLPENVQRLLCCSQDGRRTIMKQLTYQSVALILCGYLLTATEIFGKTYSCYLWQLSNVEETT